MTARLLAQLTAGMISVPAEIVVTDVTLDSRESVPGGLFLACRGRTHHGLEFAKQAIARGARTILFESGPDVGAGPDFGSEIFVAGIAQLSESVGTIADRFFGAPSLALAVAGITGTNGKTTSAFLLAQALGLSGQPAAYMGTLGSGLPGVLQPGTHTTADAVSVHRHLEAFRRLGATCVSMEVSSHALDQARVDGVRFRTAVFTNLTRDHLDYHGTMAAYAHSKARLFAWPTLSTRVINIDDPFGAELAARASPARLIVTTRNGRAPAGAEFVRASRVHARETGLVIAIDSSWGAIEIEAPLLGEFNVDNVLAVLAVLQAWNVPLEVAGRALAQCHAPSGRMEALGGGASVPLVIVDYAHTPDALSKALRAARAHCRGRLHVVFGCGGDRDAGKRPLMGGVAAELADEVIITDDNPRTEDPRTHRGGDTRGHHPNRVRSASSTIAQRPFSAPCRLRDAGDVVLIAGKGHEDYQIHGARTPPVQ